MRRFSILISLAILTLTCVRVKAQDAPRAEIFGGYQFFHANSGISFAGFDSFNLNGWDGSLNGYFNRYLGITTDISGAHGTPHNRRSRRGFFWNPYPPLYVFIRSCLDPQSASLTEVRFNPLRAC
jgi:hypothetical protein